MRRWRRLPRGKLGRKGGESEEDGAGEIVGIVRLRLLRRAVSGLAVDDVPPGGGDGGNSHGGREREGFRGFVLWIYFAM